MVGAIRDRGEGKTVAILQPSYLPWIGYLDQLDAADLFVFYDDVQYDKGGWRNRNRIKTQRGVRWLTVPVKVEFADSPPRLDTIQTSGDRWRRKHLETIRQSYARAAGFDRIMGAIERTLARDTASLVEMAIDTVSMLAEAMAIDTPTLRSSTLGIGGERNERLINICRELGATRYLSGAAARSYLDPDAFAETGIELLLQDYQHPTYTQLHGDFVPYLSALDLVANEPERALEILRSGRRFTFMAGGH